MNDGAKEARLSEIPQQMDKLKMEIARADEQGACLSDRLSSVLSEQDPPVASSAEGATPEAILTPLASNIRECASTLRTVNDAYDVLLQTIEL